MTRVLVVDDEKNIVELLKFNLEKEGYEVLVAYDGIKAVEVAKEERPDLILLDLMLPGQSGLEVCRILRKETKVPIIMATAKGEEIDKILGLEIGADDYVTKPFSPREVIARIKAVMRRVQPKVEEKEELTFKDMKINLVKHEVKIKGQEIELKPKEFELLKLLAANPGKVYKREVLLELLWGYDYLGDTRTVDVHVRRLRQKLEASSSINKSLKTIHGIGYKFQLEED